MNRCGDCKFWGDEHDIAVNLKRRVCQTIPDYLEVPNPEDHPAVASGAHGEAYTFETHADFGCTLWEAAT
jgi:hypothetical protein